MVGFWIAAALSALAFAVHAFVGTKEVGRPLLESDMAEVPKYRVYLCGHIVTWMCVVMTAGFVWAAFGTTAGGVLMATLAGGTAIWGFALQRTSGLKFTDLPQWTALLAITAAGTWGSLDA